MIKITEINPIYSKINHPEVIRDLLSYPTEYWIRGLYGKKDKRDSVKRLIYKDGEFLTGFTDRIISFLNKNNVEYTLEKLDYEVSPCQPALPEIKFRADQTRQMMAALKRLRGVLIAPTGAGKTVLIAGLISCFPKAKILFLVHTIDLVDQTIAEFKRFGFTDISRVDGKHKDISGRIVVSTVQSFSRFDFLDYCDKFDVVFTDEGHHQGKFPSKKQPLGGNYYKVLSKLDASVRFAVTATLPTNPEVLMCLEGLNGSVLDEFTFEEAIKADILAVPQIEFVPVASFSDFNVQKYADIYKKAIVNNYDRNRSVIQMIKRLNRQGLTSVTYVQQIEHIDNLMSVAKEMNCPLYAVQGLTESKKRLDLKNSLHEKRIMNVVATVVWKEGINIKSLNAIIIAGGGKNEKDLIQSCGRGARKDEGKNEFIIVDFVDTAKYLSQHFCERMKVYIKKGWI